jgi:hypothetical protein
MTTEARHTLAAADLRWLWPCAWRWLPVIWHEDHRAKEQGWVAEAKGVNRSVAVLIRRSGI